MNNNTKEQCSNRWQHRTQPQVIAPEERSMFYNKQHNEVFKNRFSFDLNDSQKSLEEIDTTSKSLCKKIK